MSAALCVFALDRGRAIELLDDLDLNVAVITHGNGQRLGGGLALVELVWEHASLKQKPRTRAQGAAELPH